MKIHFMVEDLLYVIVHFNSNSLFFYVFLTASNHISLIFLSCTLNQLLKYNLIHIMCPLIQHLNATDDLFIHYGRNVSHICFMLNSQPPFPHLSSPHLTCLFISILCTGIVSSGSLSSSLLCGECSLMRAIASQEWIVSVRCIFTLSVSCDEG